MFTIPRLTSEGHRITFIRLVPGVDIADFEPKALFKRFFMMSDIRCVCLSHIFTFSKTHLTGARLLNMKLIITMSFRTSSKRTFAKCAIEILCKFFRFKEESDCNGDVFLIDLTGFTYSHAVKTFSGGLLTKFIKSLKVFIKNIMVLFI